MMIQKRGKMILSVTKLVIKKPIHFFPVSYYAFKVMLQLKFHSRCKGVKTLGFGFTTYTMTLWENEADLKSFFASGAHKVAMGKVSLYAKNVYFARADSDCLISWTQAKALLPAAPPVNSTGQVGADTKT